MLSVRQNIDLLPYNTFGFSVRAEKFATLRSREDLDALTELTKDKSDPVFILGGGSNVLLTRNIPGLVVKVEIEGIATLRTSDDHVWVEAGAGLSWHSLVQYCVRQGWGGIENLSLIPGCVGAAPIQNIGAYGVELQEVFVSLQALELSTGKASVFTAADCRFSYRDSIFKHEGKGRHLISSVALKLTRRNHRLNTTYGNVQKTLEEMKVSSPDIATISEAVIRIRSSKLPDPFKVGNAGSFFKNPELRSREVDLIRRDHPAIPLFPGSTSDTSKVPAGWLIEQCGWKGERIGHVGVHSEQALVLVHFGGGTGDEIAALAANIYNSVRSRFGIELEKEVNII